MGLRSVPLQVSSLILVYLGYLVANVTFGDLMMATIWTGHLGLRRSSRCSRLSGMWFEPATFEP